MSCSIYTEFRNQVSLSGNYQDQMHKTRSGVWDWLLHTMLPLVFGMKGVCWYCPRMNVTEAAVSIRLSVGHLDVRHCSLDVDLLVEDVAALFSAVIRGLAVPLWHLEYS